VGEGGGGGVGPHKNHPQPHPHNPTNKNQPNTPTKWGVCLLKGPGGDTPAPYVPGAGGKFYRNQVCAGTPTYCFRSPVRWGALKGNPQADFWGAGDGLG